MTGVGEGTRARSNLNGDFCSIFVYVLKRKKENESPRVYAVDLIARR